MIRTQDFDDDGSAFVWMIALCGLCIVVLAGVIHLGIAVKSVSKVQSAADASALSAAYEIAHFNDSKACSSARETAQKNNTTLDKCTHDNNEVVVQVHLNIDSTVTAQARAEIN